jgi:hypothetical protein
MSVYYYILDEKNNPVLEPDILKWATWLENKDRSIVARDDLPGNIMVSTIFLGVDQNFLSSKISLKKPLLWETMIFGSDQDEYRCRYDSHDAALAGHREAVQLAKTKKPGWRK